MSTPARVRALDPTRDPWLLALDRAPEAKRLLLEALAFQRAIALDEEHRASDWNGVMRSRGKIEMLDTLTHAIEGAR